MTAVSGAGLSCRDFVSLRDVLEISGQAFMNAVQEMRRIQVIIDQHSEDQTRESIPDEIRESFNRQLEEMAISSSHLFARLTFLSINRDSNRMRNDLSYSWKSFRDDMLDIDLRLNDEVGLIKMFVLDGSQSMALQSGHELLGSEVADRYPSMLFEVEEAAKCLALGRSTASAFHSMRALEIALKGFAAFLKISDPVAPAQRNWAFVLNAIKDAIDSKYPAKSRMPGSEGAEVEALYASLDAMKNPWRNATMHTENVYQPHEANHILQCLNVFVVKLASICDEDGARIAP